MDIITDGPLWSDEDMVLWRAFLDTQTGKRVIHKMLESCPPLPERGEINEILIRVGVVRGLGLAAKGLLSMAQPVLKDTAAPSLGYEQLENDAAWNDGQKLT